MADPFSSWLSRYRRNERSFDIAFWVIVLGVQGLANTLVNWIELRRGNPAQPIWQPAVWELTGAIVVGALIPMLAAWERRHPIRLATWPGWLPWHLAGTLAFTAIKVAGMLALRHLVYAALGLQYRPATWPTVFAYEYLKDVRSYALILAAFLGWRFLLVRSQGEFRVLDAPESAAGTAIRAAEEPQPAVQAALPERFLVRKLRKEFLIPATDIDWLQAQGNYLGLRVNGHDYLLRSPLGDFLDQLDPARFARVHRSWAVNLDRIAEIEPQDSGDARLTMKDGSVVPCSRRYRDALTASPVRPVRSA